MRASVTIAVPVETTAGQLRVLASLLATIERAWWESLVRTFDKMDRDRAELPEPLETMLGHLAGQLRLAAREREDEPALTLTPAPAPASGAARDG